MKHLRMFGVVCLILSSLLFPSIPAKAFGPCDGTVTHAAPQVHDLWNSNRLVYETKASLNIVYTNTNAYLCHMTYDFQVTTSVAGWKFENLVCIGTCNNPHVVWSGMSVPDTACIWLDGSTHKAMECQVDVPSGVTLKLQQIWQNSAIGGGTDNSYYGLCGRDAVGSTCYSILSGNDSIY